MSVDLMIARPEDRRDIPGVRFHVRSGPYAKGSFCQIDENVFVTSPELTLVDIAPKLSYEARVQMTMMFCGTYTTVYGTPGFYRRHEPISSVESITRFVEEA